MNRTKNIESRKWVFFTDEVDHTQVSIPSWVSIESEPRNILSILGWNQDSTNSLKVNHSQHPKPFSGQPLYNSDKRDMIGGKRDYRGRLFHVGYITSDPPKRVYTPYFGTLEFKSGTKYQFITCLDSLKEGEWYQFRGGSLDSIPHSEEVLWITDVGEEIEK